MTPRRFLALDLETVPDEELVAAVDGEPTRPYPEQLRRLLDERRKRSGGRSDFLPTPYHRPVAACTLEAEERDGVVRVVEATAWTDRSGPDEATFLRRTWQRIAGRTVVSFHGRGFDLPVLELRSLKLGVPAPRWFQGARAEGAEEHLDLLELLSNGRASPAAPLDLYAKLVGLPGKEEVAGRDVHSLYASGAIDRIAAYCMTDVVQTWLLFLRFRLVEGTLSREGYDASVRSVRDDLPPIARRSLAPGEVRLLDGWMERCAPFFGERVPARQAR
ncbi:MAG: 3'-5' exonuclease [Deltaproteobacteria bacterium]|nr:3'-5' exonuclease [Deltaproteobacteria bacterium]